MHGTGFLSFLPASVPREVFCAFKYTVNLKPGHVLVLVVEVLCCKAEGCGFDSRWCH